MKLQRSLVAFLAVFAIAACAAPAPTATPTGTPVAAATQTKAAPTPTKAPTAPPTKRPLIKAGVAPSSTGLTFGPVWVAQSKGYFREEGLDIDVTITGAGTKSLAAAVGKSADVGLVAAPDVLSAVAQGQPVQTFGVISTRSPQELTMRKDVAASKGVTPKSSLEEKAKALKGLRLAASTPGSATDLDLRFLLTKYNIDPEREVEITYIALQNMLPALQQGAIDVMTKSPPDSTLAVKEGFGVILVSFLGGDVPEVNDNLYVMAVSHKDVIASRSEVVEAFTRALWRGEKLIQENRNDAIDVLHKETSADMDRDLFRQVFDAYYPTYPPSPAVTEKNFQATVGYRDKTSKEPLPSIKFEDFYTSKVVEAAKKQLGF
ncbi:MAG: ABC transporter substrate-binding protein [Chloroflexi bacterium]|nr:ABC transporter substrate-binding protein [Chloroflexota bacterium]